MPSTITNLQVGDVVYVAWIDLKGECQNARVRIQYTHQSHEGGYLVDVSTDSERFQIVQEPPSPCFAIDSDSAPDDRPVMDADGNIFGRPVLGIAQDAGPFLLQVMFRVLEMGYSPADALDLIALEFELYPAAPYAALRGVPEEELRAHVDDLVSDMAPSTGL